MMAKLHQYLLEIRDEVLPKSPGARAVRYALNQWEALTRFLEDGDLEIDNGATERANRDIAIGRGNWTFFGSDDGGKTAAMLMSFIAMCKRYRSSHSPGSATCSRASPRIRLIGSLNCSRITGNLSRLFLPTPDPKAVHGSGPAPQGGLRAAYPHATPRTAVNRTDQLKILGLNAFHGDSSAAVLRDGQLTAALEEERLNRIKHWAGLPVQAAQACLDGAQPDHIAISRDPKAHLGR